MITRRITPGWEDLLRSSNELALGIEYRPDEDVFHVKLWADENLIMDTGPFDEMEDAEAEALQIRERTADTEDWYLDKENSLFDQLFTDIP